ncbi:hypothetical protein M0R45_035588 [Rubus argutus]|uniref:Uncharacterized protein n=1 Tax=Rubus argutus TaxID=59490 RepID=A0AAW1VXU0_RUBAR
MPSHLLYLSSELRGAQTKEDGGQRPEAALKLQTSLVGSGLTRGGRRTMRCDALEVRRGRDEARLRWLGSWRRRHGNLWVALLRW